MRENDLHDVLAGLGPWPGHVVVGPGDDCAVLVGAGGGGGAGGGVTIATVDQVVEGVHFAPGEDLELVARKCIARSISDIAAMGGAPRWALATGAIPAAMTHDDAKRLLLAVHRWGRHWGCPVVGGDITGTSGPLVLSVTAVGVVEHARGAVLRGGAKPGDGVYVTGRLGGSLASGRHLRFEPRVVEGAWLAQTLGTRLHAMMDLSDGLGIDGTRLARASGVRLLLDAAALPMHEGVAGWRNAAGDGEDYELLFAAGGEVPSACGTTGTAITRIGTVQEGKGCVIVAGGVEFEGGGLGWEHGG